MSHELIPHSRPMIGEREVEAVADVVRSGHIAQGRKVEEFEEALARYVGVKGAVAVNSGTSALSLGLEVKGYKPGAGIMLPSYVCTAPLNAVYRAGYEPYICDVDGDSYNISDDDIRSRKDGNCSAVIVPHMFGSPADIERIEEAGLEVIEDCAHAAGARYGEHRVGSLGTFSFMSFYANKMIACGEGGAVLSDNRAFLEAVRDLRDYDRREGYRARVNYKMTDMQAALGIVQLSRLPDMINRRRELAASYDRAFGVPGVELPRGEFDHVYYRYVIRVKADLRDLIRDLPGKGVICARPVFKPLHRYLELRSGYHNTDEVFSSALSIPLYPSLSDNERDRVIAAVKSALP